MPEPAAPAPPAESAASSRGRPWPSLVWLFVAWLGSRLLVVSVGLWELPFYPKGPLAFDDLIVYARWLPILGEGRLPADDMWQYPPLSAFFFQLGRIGPDAETALLVAIVLVDLVLTAVLAWRDVRAGWWWVLFGLLIGPVLVSRFDVVPTLFAVLAVLAAVRPVRVGVWAAVGTALKLWPVLVLAVVPRRGILRAGAAFLIVLLALLGLSAAVYDGLTGFLAGQGSRGLQVEAVAAVPFLVLKAAGLPVEMQYRFGAEEVASDGAGAAAVAVTVLAVLLFAWVAVSWWRGRLERAVPADVAFTVVSFSVVASRVFSPQYSVWLLGLGALCMVSPGSRVRTPVLLVAVAAALTQILYPYGYGRLLAGDPLMVTIQAVRILLVVTATGWAAYQVLIRPADPPDPLAADSPVARSDEA